MYPPGIHQARCNYRSLGRGQQIGNYIFSAPPFRYLTIFGWQPEQNPNPSTSSRYLWNPRKQNVRSLGEGSKLAIVMNNKTSRPPTYIFHGPLAKTTAADMHSKNMETTKINTIQPPRTIQSPKSFRF